MENHLTKPVALLVTVLAAAGCERAVAPTPFAVEDSHRLPGEFEPVEELIIGWDSELDSFFVELTMAAAPLVPMTIVVGPYDTTDRIEELLDHYVADTSQVRLVEGDVESVWVRDYGPLTVVGEDGARSFVDLRYPGSDPDDALPTKLGRDLYGWQVHEAPVGLDGGNLLSDGAGRCLTTEYALDPDRLVGTEADLRAALRALFGCEKLFILPELERESTGHVDMYAMIPGPGRVIIGSYDPLDDEHNARLLDGVAAELARGGFQVERIPMGANSDARFRTFTNALTLDDALLVPIYLDAPEGQEAAIDVLASAYPDRAIVPLISDEIIELGGAVHCATQTIPRVQH